MSSQFFTTIAILFDTKNYYRLFYGNTNDIIPETLVNISPQKAKEIISKLDEVLPKDKELEYLSKTQELLEAIH